jgi:hypothetical protein
MVLVVMEVAFDKDVSDLVDKQRSNEQKGMMKMCASSMFNVFFLVFFRADLSHLLLPCQKDLHWWYWHRIMDGDIAHGD